MKKYIVLSDGFCRIYPDLVSADLVFDAVSLYNEGPVFLIEVQPDGYCTLHSWTVDARALG